MGNASSNSDVSSSDASSSAASSSDIKVSDIKLGNYYKVIFLPSATIQIREMYPEIKYGTKVTELLKKKTC